jgi:hypothetical protein
MYNNLEDRSIIQIGIGEYSLQPIIRKDTFKMLVFPRSLKEVV